MSKLVIGIVVIAVIVGIFVFAMRDSPDLAPRKQTNAEVKQVYQKPTESNVKTASELAGMVGSSPIVSAQQFALMVSTTGSSSVPVSAFGFAGTSDSKTASSFSQKLLS